VAYVMNDMDTHDVYDYGNDDDAIFDFAGAGADEGGASAQPSVSLGLQESTVRQHPVVSQVKLSLTMPGRPWRCV